MGDGSKTGDSKVQDCYHKRRTGDKLCLPPVSQFGHQSIPMGPRFSPLSARSQPALPPQAALLRPPHNGTRLPAS
jgi:hypothetical protein